MRRIDHPRMHCHEELLSDLGYKGSIPSNLLLKWHNDRYSTSKHLLTLYSLAYSMGRERILEVGFGRSSFALAKAAMEKKLQFITCDNRNFSYLLNDEELECTKFHLGSSASLWESLKDESVDFAFLDYFSGTKIKADFVENEIEKCLGKMKGNSVIAIHDVFDDRYRVGSVLKKMSKSFRFRKRFNYSLLPYNYGLGLLHVTSFRKNIILHDKEIKKADY